MNIAVIGAGLIGNKRARALGKDDNLIIVCDTNIKRAKEMAFLYGIDYTDDINDVSTNKIVDIAVISVINKYILPIAVKMLKSKKHILCEKPLGKNANESKKIIELAEKNKLILKTGFNHRFHPAIMKAKSIVDSGQIGEIINIRCRYGHGGRPGMENEWRCSKDLCGGGELLDQGVHLIDLTRWFLNSEIKEVFGQVYTSFWNIEVEDNVFFTLKSDNNIYVQCHASWTNWKNIFSYEIFGKIGYISINGLGGSYGLESLEVGIHQPKGGIPKIEKYEFPENDQSWILEWIDFTTAIEKGMPPNGSGIDGYIANKIVGAIYKSSEKNKPVSL